MTKTKQNIIDELAEELVITKATSKEFVNAFLGKLRTTLANDDSVRFIGDFSLSPKTTKARAGVNPSTGEKIQIPATKSVKFTVGAKLKAAVK